MEHFCENFESFRTSKQRWLLKHQHERTKFPRELKHLPLQLANKKYFFLSTELSFSQAIHGEKTAEEKTLKELIHDGVLACFGISFTR